MRIFKRNFWTNLVRLAVEWEEKELKNANEKNGAEYLILIKLFGLLAWSWVLWAFEVKKKSFSKALLFFCSFSIYSSITQT